MGIQRMSEKGHTDSHRSTQILLAHSRDSLFLYGFLGLNGFIFDRAANLINL